MKTQLQYPNGLSITIEHDEQFTAQVLNINSKKIEQLEHENNSLKRRVGELLQEVELLRNTDIKLNKTPADFNKMPIEKKEKSESRYAQRECTKCGKMYQPNGPRGNTCTQCKADASSLPDEKTETPE